MCFSLGGLLGSSSHSLIEELATEAETNFGWKPKDFGHHAYLTLSFSRCRGLAEAARNARLMALKSQSHSRDALRAYRHAQASTTDDYAFDSHWRGAVRRVHDAGEGQEKKKGKRGQRRQCAR